MPIDRSHMREVLLSPEEKMLRSVISNYRDVGRYKKKEEDGMSNMSGDLSAVLTRLDENQKTLQENQEYIMKRIEALELDIATTNTKVYSDSLTPRPKTVADLAANRRVRDE